MYTVVVTNIAGAVTSAPAAINVVSGAFNRLDTASGVMITAFPATRGYQYLSDCCVNGDLNNWYTWTNAFADYGGLIWLTNTLDNDALFLRVHSP